MDSGDHESISHRPKPVSSRPLVDDGAWLDAMAPPRPGAPLRGRTDEHRRLKVRITFELRPLGSRPRAGRSVPTALNAWRHFASRRRSAFVSTLAAVSPVRDRDDPACV